MFNYVGDISKLAQNIIKEYCLEKIVAVDATLGNGHDTDFLSEHFQRVYSIDIQKKLVESYKERSKDNVTLICDSNENVHRHIREDINCIMYNLGYCPGEDKSITTNAKSTLESLKGALPLMKSGGIITIGIYVGHGEGKKEEEVLTQYLQCLPKNQYGVMLHYYLNRTSNSPRLAVIEKK